MRQKEMNNKNHFLTPEGYFEEFHNKIMEQLQTTTGPKTHPLINIHKLRYAAAIVVTFIIGGMIYINDINNNDEVYVQNDEISNEYIDELLDNYPIDDYTFYSYLTSN